MKELKKFSIKDLVEELKTRDNISSFNYQSHKQTTSDNSISFEESGILVLIKD